MKRILAVAAVVLVMALVPGGYLLASHYHASSPQAHNPSAQAAAPATVAVAVSGFPLYYDESGTASGYFADLLQQVPLGARPWSVLPLDEAAAEAAVAARATDAALVALLAGQDTGSLASSKPLLQSAVSLLAPAGAGHLDSLKGQRIAWYGPSAVAELLVRRGATPLAAASAAECLSRTATGDAAACLMDEQVAAATIARLNLGVRIVIVGQPLATINYCLLYWPDDRSMAASLDQWILGLKRNGALASLQRKWLGALPPAQTTTAYPLTLIAVPGAGFVLALAGLAVLAARNHSLRQVLAQRSVSWQESERKYEALVQGANDAIFVLTPAQATILEANQRAEELTGYSRSELEHMRFHQLVPARHRRLVREWLIDQGEEGRIEEVPLVRKDGSIAVVEISSKVARSTARTARVCIVRNITERRYMQREIKRVTQFSERVLENMTNSLITVDADCLVTACNRAMSESLGSASDIVGRPLDEILKTKDEPLGRLVLEAMQAGDTRRHSLTLVRPDGSELPMAVTISLLHDEQVVSGAILVFTDMSHDLRNREEAQRLAMLGALGQVSSVLAHEVHDRVHGVHIGVQYLEGKFPPDDPRRESLAYIRDEAERAVEIIDDVLMLIRPGKINKRPCRVGDILQQAIESQAKRAQENGVEITASLAPDLPPVAGEAVQLVRAVTNLVKNAVQAMPQGGKVRLEADRIEQNEGGRKSQAVRIRISDTGPGLPAAVRARLFQPFTTERSGGVGLGLSIAKRIIDNHGGTMEVESRDHLGTTFSIILQAANERGGR